MHIVVCIKQVPVVSAMQFDPEAKTLKREGVPSEVSSFDIRALLKAIELKQARGGEVTVLTMGPPDARAALEHCLALGADRGIHLCDKAFAGADTLATAEALAAALRRIGFDLVLCGRNSTDAETGQVGPEVAELLDLPQITVARTLSIDAAGRTVIGERETDSGFETVSAPLPALVTAAEDLAPERFPNKAERVAGKEKPIEELTAAMLAADASRFGFAGSPTWVLGLEAVEEHRQGRIIAADNLVAAVDELVNVLRPAQGGARGDVARERHQAAVPSRVERSTPKDVLVVAEILDGAVREVTFELLHRGAVLAKSLGGSVAALLAGDGVTSHVEALAAHGAERVFVADDPSLAELLTEPHAAVLTRVIGEHRPGIVLVPSTVFGRDVAPRVAARLRLGLTGDCIDVGLDDQGRLLQYKPAFGGSVVAPIVSTTIPEMATVRPGMLPIGTADTSRRAQVVAVDAPRSAGRVHVVSERPGAEAAAMLDEAEIVVGIGKGIGGPEQLPLVQELAEVLGGVICTTRDVTDAGWLPKQYQVGLTGRIIAPRLYVAIAIRGAFEHVVGVRRAGVIVAINKNAKAPIFKVADYGIVADYAECLPLLIQRLRAARGG